MPYTLTMTTLWLVLTAIAGVVVGYLLRGRTSVVDVVERPGGRQKAATARALADEESELEQLRHRVERLETQLSITVAERDWLRQQMVSTDPVTPDPAVAPQDEEPQDQQPQDEELRDGSAQERAGGDRVLE